MTRLKPSGQTQWTWAATLLLAAFVYTPGATPALAASSKITSVTIADDKVFPESITSTKAGDLIVGSNSKGTIYRAKAGSDKATPWIEPATSGMVAVLGVFADDASNTLYVCSIAPPAPQGTPRQTQYVALRTFDLTTGAAKATYAMVKPERAVCNDVDVAKDGTVYVADTAGRQVLRLKKGAPGLEIWVHDEEHLGGVDGVALGDGVLYVGSVTASRLFAIPIGRDGAAGAVTELQTPDPLVKPDGMRALGGNHFLLAEQGGRVSEVTVTGNNTSFRVIKNEPGVTAITKNGNTVWLDNAKFDYRGNGPKKDESPEPFVMTAVPFK